MADEGEKFSTCISLHSEVNIKENPQKGWCIFFDRRMQITQVYLHKKTTACKISTEIQQIHHRVNDRPQWQMVCVYMSFFLGHPACLCIWAADTAEKHFIKVRSWNTLKHRKGACLSAAHHSTKIPPIIIHWSSRHNTFISSNTREIFLEPTPVYFPLVPPPLHEYW